MYYNTINIRTFFSIAFSSIGYDSRYRFNYVKWNSNRWSNFLTGWMYWCRKEKCVFIFVQKYTLNAFSRIVKTRDQRQFVCQLVYLRWSNLRHDTGELKKFEIRHPAWREERVEKIKHND